MWPKGYSTCRLSVVAMGRYGFILFSSLDSRAYVPWLKSPLTAPTLLACNDCYCPTAQEVGFRAFEGQ